MVDVNHFCRYFKMKTKLMAGLRPRISLMKVLKWEKNSKLLTSKNLNICLVPKS